MSDVTIRISGVGSSREVTVESGSTLADLDLDNEGQGTDVRVNGESVSPDTPLSAGDQVTQTPQGAKLGV
jgi:hypothetical protein